MSHKTHDCKGNLGVDGLKGLSGQEGEGICSQSQKNKP